MARSGITIDDRAWFDAMREIIAEGKVDAVKQVRERAERTAAAAKRYAPRARDHDPREPVLADSITVEESIDERGIPCFDTGTSVEHGLYQEYGTSTMAAHPFLRPAVEENLD